MLRCFKLTAIRSGFDSTRIALLIIAAAGFFLRSLPFRNFMGNDGGYILGGPDSYDHLRRIALGVKAFPGLPPHDYYYGYPIGTGQIWAPLFDYTVSLFALIVGLGHPSPHTIAFIGFWLPPVLAFCTGFMVYSVARRMFGTAAGITAAAVIAILPGHILYSYVSRLDHHVAEPMLCLVLAGSLLKGVERDCAKRSLMLDAFATACALDFALLVWRGSVIFWGIAFGALLLYLMVGGVRNESWRRTAAYGASSFFIAAAMLLPVCTFNIWGTAGGMTAGMVSWFHVLLLSVFSLIFFLLRYLSRGKIGIASGVALLSASVMLAVLPGGRTFLREFLAGIEVIAGSDPWLSSITELISVLFYKDGSLSLWYVVQNLSLFYWIFPLLMIVMLLRWRASGWTKFSYPLLMVWGGLFWLLPLFRIRYVHLAAITVAIGCGFFFILLRDLVGKVRPSFSPWIAGVIVAALCLPVASLLKWLPEEGPADFEKYDLMATLKWMRDNTPPTSYYDSPDKLPEYGVLANWGLGSHIVNVAARPALATNFGWETHGLYESAAFQVLGNPEVGEEILRKNRIRYILLNQMIGSVDADRAIAEYAYKSGKYHVAAVGDYLFFRSMYYRLMVEDGSSYRSGTSTFRALGKYRLLYEAPNGFTIPGSGDVSLFKIFEYLPGAVLSGKGAKGEKVELELGLMSSIGRGFAYRDETIVRDDGRYSFRVPYPTTAPSGMVRPEAVYLLRVGGREATASVTEDDVYGGRMLEVK
jgi:dolichyl-phosphooligosaccharide-protein glycotransferase